MQRSSKLPLWSRVWLDWKKKKHSNHFFIWFERTFYDENAWSRTWSERVYIVILHLFLALHTKSKYIWINQMVTFKWNEFPRNSFPPRSKQSVTFLRKIISCSIIIIYIHWTLNMRKMVVKVLFSGRHVKRLIFVLKCDHFIYWATLGIWKAKENKTNNALVWSRMNEWKKLTFDCLTNRRKKNRKWLWLTATLKRTTHFLYVYLSCVDLFVAHFLNAFIEL